MEWFNSPFYHKLYKDRDNEIAKTFLQTLTRHLKPSSGHRILDTACGTGTRARILAAAGFDVSGVDLSPAIIEEAKKSENENLQFFFHDIRLPFWINYFDHIFNLFTAFGYFNTRREHDDAMRTLGGALKPGGTFVIDYPNVHYKEEHIIYNETQTIDGTTFDMHRWNDDTNFYNKITVTDPSLTTPLSVTEKLAKFSLGDFTDMLSYQSLQVQEVYGDYDLSPYHVRNTPRLIIIAKKKSNDPSDKEKRIYSDGRSTDPLT